MFKFKLNALLTLKENMESSKKRELGVLNQAYQEKEKQLQTIQENMNMTREALRASSQGTLDFNAIQQYKYYLEHQQKEMYVVKEQLQNLSHKISLKKDELLEAVKERKIMENLKEMKKQEYMDEERQEEQKQVDELVSYKYTQKSQGGENG